MTPGWAPLQGPVQVAKGNERMRSLPQQRCACCACLRKGQRKVLAIRQPGIPTTAAACCVVTIRMEIQGTLLSTACLSPQALLAMLVRAHLTFERWLVGDVGVPCHAHLVIYEQHHVVHRPLMQSFSQGNRCEDCAAASPCVTGGSQGGSQLEASQGLSEEALRLMYQQCLKLAAENKITQKNTWNLSLVMDQVCTIAHACACSQGTLPASALRAWRLNQLLLSWRQLVCRHLSRQNL